jgi:hypothetical protein
MSKFSALLMLYQSVAFTQIDTRPCRAEVSTSLTQSVSVVSEEALNRAHITVTELSHVERICNSSPHLMAHTTPLHPLFFFIGIRYLLAAKAIERKPVNDDALNSLTTALGSLSKQFPEAGISLRSTALIYRTISTRHREIERTKP